MGDRWGVGRLYNVTMATIRDIRGASRWGTAGRVVIMSWAMRMMVEQPSEAVLMDWRDCAVYGDDEDA